MHVRNTGGLTPTARLGFMLVYIELVTMPTSESFILHLPSNEEI